MDRVNYLFYQLFLKIKYEKRRYFLYVLSFYVGLLLPTCCIANTRSVEQVIYYTTFKGIAIMRAIINKPQILLADEPTGNLDKENSQTIMNLFERLNKQGMTIVMVTHDTSLAKYGTRVVRVEDGRIIEKGKEILK